MKNSQLFKLNTADLTKGLFVAMITAVLVFLNQSLAEGAFVLDWNAILKTAASAAVAYLLKNLFTNSDGEILQKEK